MGKYLKARFEEHPKTYQNAGSREKQNYIMSVNKDGHKILKEAGITNIYEKIQADKESADINNIIRRVTRGDTSVINAAGIYGDFTGRSTSLIDAMNIQLRAEKAWASLPAEIRKEYDNDVQKYLADFGTEHFWKLHGIEPNKEVEPIKEEVKTDA